MRRFAPFLLSALLIPAPESMKLFNNGGAKAHQ
jgi:hypothetical protein